MTELPDLPSALIRLAVHDLELVESDSRYRVSMDYWHRPNTSIFGCTLSFDFKYCNVCLAGAVLAKSIGVAPDAIMRLCDLEPVVSNKMVALDNFRVGKINRALSYMNHTHKENVEDREVVPYEQDPKFFKAEMLEIADYLETFEL